MTFRVVDRLQCGLAAYWQWVIDASIRLDLWWLDLVWGPE